MAKQLLLTILAVLACALLAAGPASGQPVPEFKLGFRALAEQIPQVAGQPTEEEHYGANGDSLQRTTTGLMVWRKADNWTAFTNGARTWLNGPAGVRERANDERFEWEADAAGHPRASGSAAASVAGRIVASSEVPQPVSRLVPAGATLLSAAAADFTGSGEITWAVAYSVPTGMFFEDLHLAFLPGSGEAWRERAGFVEEGVVLPELELVRLSGRPSLVLSSYTGAHSSQTTIVRWDGEKFRAVFEGGSNSPGMEARDLDGDGTVEVVDPWSPYCGSYAASPKSISIYRWDGAGFVEDLSRYPKLVEATAAGLRSALRESETNPAWAEEDRQCLRDALEELAEKSRLVQDDTLR